MHSTGRLKWALLLCVFLSYLSLSDAQQGPPQQPAPDSISNGFVLDDGTPIKLRLIRELSSANAKPGNTIDFEVLEEVKVGDVIVIPKGSSASGTVTAAQGARRMGRAGKLEIEIDYVRLADGEKATLRAREEANGESHVGDMVTSMVVITLLSGGIGAPLALFQEGENSMIPRDTQITAYVNGTMQLESAKFKTPSAPPPTTRLQIRSQPSRAEISVDGNFVGSTPSEIDIASGLHTITISKAHCTTWKRTLMLSAGERTVIATLYQTEIKLR